MKTKGGSFYQILRPGKALVEYGPVVMTIEGSSGHSPLTRTVMIGAEVAVALLDELASYLPIARQKVSNLDPNLDSTYPEVLRRMLAAVRQLGEGDFTPMAAVAGTFSDLVKETVVAAGADKVVVNNGGDIALHLGVEAQCLRAGVVSDLTKGKITHRVNIHSHQRIGGIATSGLGGRSLTKGVASAVTVLAKNGSFADAAATAIANATDCDEPTVEKCLAEELDPLTDIRGHWVTRRVGRLNVITVEEALSRGFKRFMQLYQQGMVKGVVIFVQGKIRMFPHNLVHPWE